MTGRAVRARVRGLRKRLHSATRRLRRRGPPVLVYQMGKVGSSTVFTSLLALDPPREVDHIHLLNNLDAIEDSVRSAYPDPDETLAQIERGRKLRARVARGRDTQWPVITLVRDPVQRNVSAFFQNLTEVVPDAYARHARGELAATDLRDAFLERYDHNAPLAWFQTQLEPVFGIDVFSTPFDTARGYATYESPMARLLLIRLEDLGTCGAPAIRDFLQLDRFELLRANTGSEKEYADLYAEFEHRIDLPESYLARMYDSQLARHFYDDAEIAGFRRRWTAGGA